MDTSRRLALFLIAMVLAISHSGFPTSRMAESQPLEARALTLDFTVVPALGSDPTPTLDPTLPPAVLPTEVPTPTPTNTPAPEPRATIAPEPTATPLAKIGLPDLGGFVKVKDTESFSFYAEPGSYALRNIDDLAGEAERLLQEMNGRVGERLDGTVSFYLYSAGHDDFAGLSFVSPLLIYQELRATSDRLHVKAVIGHELVHLIVTRALGYTENRVHLEGVAHWASNGYWAAAIGEHFDKKVRRYLATSRNLPLADLLANPSRWLGATQTVAYDQAGSFVGHLIQTYGLNRFKRVYLRSSYEEVYGKSLRELEGDWLAYLDSLPD